MPFADPQVTSIISVACALASASCAIWVALRDSRWRKHGLAKQLEDRIALAQKSADNWHMTAQATAIRHELDRQGGELDRQGGVIIGHASSIGNCATRADLIRVEGMVRETKSLANHTATGVDRIEAILIKRALGERAQ